MKKIDKEFIYDELKLLVKTYGKLKFDFGTKIYFLYEI